jgi:tetratricopeptide (TPR) repeat protein
MERIGDCYNVSGDHKKAADIYLRALQQWRVAIRHSLITSEIPLELADEIPLKAREATLCHKIGLSCVRNSDYDSSLKWLETAYQVLPPRQPLSAAKINITKSISLYRKGKFDEAIYWGRLGLDLSRRTGNKSQLAYAHNILAACYLELGQVKRSVHQRILALELCQEEGDLYGQSSVHNNLGICYLQLGELDRALYHFEEGLKIDKRIGSLTAAAIKHNNIGEVLIIRGQLEEALNHFHEVVSTYKRTGNPVAAAGLALVNLSRASQKKQEYKKAVEYLQQGIQLLKKTGDRGMVTEANLQEAELYLETENIDSALITCQRALKKARELNIKLLEARGLRILGRIDSFRGIYERAEANIQQSVTIAKQINADYERGLALLYLAELYVKSINTRDYQYKGKLTLKHAISIFQRIGAKRDLAYANMLKTTLQS